MIVISQLLIFLALVFFFFKLYEEMTQESELNFFSDKRRREGFDQQLVEALLIIGSSLKAGRNLEQAFELVALSMPSPICDEFRMVLQERKLGISFEKALDNLLERIQSEDLELVVNAIKFQKDTGGSLEDLFRQIVHTVGERKRIMGKVRSGTTHARLSGTVVTAIPVVLLILMFLSKNTTFANFIDHAWGRIALIISLGLVTVGWLITHKLTQGVLPEQSKDVYLLNDPALKRQQFSVSHRMSGALAATIRNFRDPFTERQRQQIEKKLVLAGRPGELSADQFLALKVIFGIIGATLFWVFALKMKWHIMLVWSSTILVFFMAFYCLNFYLNSRIAHRRINIEFELPNMIDLISLATEANMDFTQAIAKVVEKSHPSDIISEFKIFLAEIKLGKTVEQAMADMASRIQILSFLSFASSIAQAKTLGAEIGPTLRAQSELMRHQRFLAVEEAANKLPILLLIPLVTCIFPALLIIILGPSLLDYWRNFREEGGIMAKGFME